MKTGRIAMQARKSLQNITAYGLRSFSTIRMAENELAQRKTAPSMERTGREFLIFSITRELLSRSVKQCVYKKAGIKFLQVFYPFSHSYIGDGQVHGT